MKQAATLQEAMTDALRTGTGMVKVGQDIPGGPAGDIWVSCATIAQLGEAEVRRMVRAQFSAAYAHAERQRRA